MSSTNYTNQFDTTQLYYITTEKKEEPDHYAKLNQQ